MKIIIIGAKNPETGRMIAAINAAQSDSADPDQFIGFLDNNTALHGRSFLGLPVLGGLADADRWIGPDVAFVNTITGSTLARYETSREVAAKGGRFTNLIHPAVNRPARMGVGNYLQEGVTIQAAAEIGDNSSIHTGTVVAHESRIGHSTFVAHMVSVSGEVTIGDGVFVGTMPRCCRA